MKPFSDYNLSLEEKAKNRVIELLKLYGYPIKRNELSKTFSQSELTPEQANELHNFPGLKFDIYIGYKGKDTAYLAEIKGRSKERFKNWVDIDVYDDYYEISKLPFPLLYFVWVEETDKVYRHEITNPEKFETGEGYGGIPIYKIPIELIHEVKLNDDILLSMCMTGKTLLQIMKRHKGWK